MDQPDLRTPTQLHLGMSDAHDQQMFYGGFMGKTTGKPQENGGLMSFYGGLMDFFYDGLMGFNGISWGFSGIQLSLMGINGVEWGLTGCKTNHYGGMMAYIPNPFRNSH